MSLSPMINSVDIFVFAHQEGNWLGSSLASVNRAMDFAVSRGLDCKKSLILRTPDQATVDWVRERLTDWTTLTLDDASLSDARNAAGDLANETRLAAFIDGSDMVGEEWFCQAAALLAQKGRMSVCHPQALMTFGPDSFSPDGFEVVLQPEQTPAEPAMLSGNPYPSGFVATGDVVRTIKWPQSNPAFGWGHVDWWWHCLPIESGVEHKIVPGVAHYRRMSVRRDLTDKMIRPGPIRLKA